MKKIIHFLLSLTLLVGTGYGLAGCSSNEEPTPEPVPNEKTKVELAAGDVTPGNATVILNAKGIRSYAFVTYTKADAPASIPSAAVINATGATGDCAEGLNTIRIYDANAPETEYVVYFALTTEDGDFYKEVLKVEFKTSAIGETVALVQSKPDGLVVNINVPESVKEAGHVLRYTFADWFTFHTRGMGLDSDALIYNTGKFLSESATLTLDNEHAYDWDDLDPNGDPISLYNLMCPGEPILFVVGEFGLGNTPMGWTEGYYDPCFDLEKYLNDMGGGAFMAAEHRPSPLALDPNSDEDKYWTGYHSRHVFYTSMPEKMEQKVSVSVTNLSTTGFTINFIPDDGIKYYCIYVADEQLYKDYTQAIGGEELWQWFVTSNAGMWEGGMTVMPENGEEFAGPRVLPCTEFMLGYPQAGSTYHVIVTAIGSEDAMKQSFTHEIFQVPNYTMSAPQVVVTPLPEKSTDSFIYFNVKNANPSVPIVVAKSLCNYDREWDLAGADYASMLASYGVPLSVEDIAKINSEEGLEFEYPTRPNATSRMAMYVENLEGLANDLSSGTTAVAEVRSKPRADAPRVESPLFDDLCGEWTATASVSVWNYSDGGYTPKAEPVSTPVTIAGGIEIAETVPSDLVDLYPLWTPEKLAAMYEEYKEEGALFNRSVRGQNRLLCLGFNFEQDKTFAQRLALQTPYDLLIHPSYSTPTVANIFYDFGPKWYLQIAEGDKVTAPINSEEFSPLSNWADRSLYTMVAHTGTEMLGVNPEATGNDRTLHFPVEVSADKNRITINPYVYEGKTYYPSLAYSRQGAYSQTGTLITSPIVLTRGGSGAVSAVRPSIFKPAGSGSPRNRIRMGRTSFEGKTVTPLKASPYLEEARARMDRRMGR